MNRRSIVSTSAICAVLFSSAALAQVSPLAAQTFQRGELKVTVGPPRMIMRGPMFPSAQLFKDGSIVVVASAVEEGGPVRFVRSTDRGETWRPFQPPAGYTMPNVELPDGTALYASGAVIPLAERPGEYQTARYESKDHGLTGTASNGTLSLPLAECSPTKPHHFHGNTIVTSRGELLSVMQGMEEKPVAGWPEGGATPFKCYLVKSTDRAHTWKYVSQVAGLGIVTGAAAEALKQGWRVWGPCEPALAEVGDGRLVCVMRTLNDDVQPLIGSQSDTYRDLSTELSGADLFKGSLKLPDEKYFSLSPPTSPLLICYSSDGGAHWTTPVAMSEARGCMPQLAYDGELLALSAGALHYPRWGNGITFSTDRGSSWTERINFAPYFTSGYGALLVLEPGRFLVFFDNASPQPWKDHATHWVGVSEIRVERQ
jgi:hypothetical protein